MTIWKKHREVLTYIIFGGLTTVVNIALFMVLTALTSLSTGTANATPFTQKPGAIRAEDAPSLPPGTVSFAQSAMPPRPFGALPHPKHYRPISPCFFTVFCLFLSSAKPFSLPQIW